MKLRDPATSTRSPVARPRRRVDGRRHRARDRSRTRCRTARPTRCSRTTRSRSALGGDRRRGRRRRAVPPLLDRVVPALLAGARSSTSRRRRPTASSTAHVLLRARIGDAAEEQDRAASCGRARCRRTACRPARWSAARAEVAATIPAVAAAATVPCSSTCTTTSCFTSLTYRSCLPSIPERSAPFGSKAARIPSCSSGVTRLGLELRVEARHRQDDVGRSHRPEQCRELRRRRATTRTNARSSGTITSISSCLPLYGKATAFQPVPVA